MLLLSRRSCSGVALMAISSFGQLVGNGTRSKTLAGGRSVIGSAAFMSCEQCPTIGGEQPRKPASLPWCCSKNGVTRLPDTCAEGGFPFWRHGDGAGERFWNSTRTVAMSKRVSGSVQRRVGDEIRSGPTPIASPASGRRCGRECHEGSLGAGLHSERILEPKRLCTRQRCHLKGLLPASQV